MSYDTRMDVISRRTFLGAAALSLAGSRSAFAADHPYSFRYIVASCMYGELPLSQILPEIRNTGASEIDLWPRVHGNQREQIDTMGHDAFRDALEAHDVSLGIITRYDLGPYNLQDEMNVVRSLGGNMIVTGSGNVEGASEKERVKKFVEKMKPHVAKAEELGVTIAIENHGNQLIYTPDSLRYFAEYAESDSLGIALAPYHLEQDASLIANLIRDVGPKMVHFYAWEYGMGCTEKLPKRQELKQLPGFGSLDFTPIIKALRDTLYAGRTSIFMHPVPRGIPIYPTAPEVTHVMNRSREYLEYWLGNVNG